MWVISRNTASSLSSPPPSSVARDIGTYVSITCAWYPCPLCPEYPASGSEGFCREAEEISLGGLTATVSRPSSVITPHCSANTRESSAYVFIEETAFSFSNRRARTNRSSATLDSVRSDSEGRTIEKTACPLGERYRSPNEGSR